VIKEVPSAIAEDMEGAFTAAKTAAQKHGPTSPRLIQTYTRGFLRQVICKSFHDSISLIRKSLLEIDYIRFIIYN
jgi:hypothetical protein